MVNYLKEIILSLAEHKIRFIICGGVAAVLQGVERMTVDIDLSVDLLTENMKSFLKIMEKLSLKPRAPVHGEVLLDKKKIDLLIKEKNAVAFTFIDTQNPFRQIDVLLIEQYNYNKLLNDTDIVEIGGFPVKILKKQKLIELKSTIKPLREKDLWDIKELSKLIKKK